jgi:regulator of nucleoside diphosphate kinase
MFERPYHSDPLPPIYIVEDEYEYLSDIICRSSRGTPGLSLLWQELKRAQIVPGLEAPEDLVCMNSMVHFTGTASEKHRAARLVYPIGPRPNSGSVSVATSVGAALIGLRTGSEFCWVTDDNRRHVVRVEKVEQDMTRAEKLVAERRQILKKMLAEFYGTD